MILLVHDPGLHTTKIKFSTLNLSPGIATSCQSSIYEEAKILLQGELPIVRLWPMNATRLWLAAD
jgi:hypothetical protein